LERKIEEELIEVGSPIENFPVRREMLACCAGAVGWVSNDKAGSLYGIDKWLEEGIGSTNSR